MVTYHWHTTRDGELHRGPSASCARCRQQGLRRTKRTKPRVAALPDLAAPRKCGKCGTHIRRENKTGFCLQCYNALRAEHKKSTAPDYRRPCANPSCTNLVNPRNKTGFCLHCYQQSEALKEQRARHKAWVTAAVCHQTVSSAASTADP